MAANQASAIESLRMIGTAEVSYSATYGVGFSTSLAALGPPLAGSLASASAAGLVDDLLASGHKSGYIFTYNATLPAAGQYYGYSVWANPSEVGVTGTDFYYTDESHVIRMDTTAQAGSTDSPIAQ